MRKQVLMGLLLTLCLVVPLRGQEAAKKTEPRAMMGAQHEKARHGMMDLEAMKARMGLTEAQVKSMNELREVHHAKATAVREEMEKAEQELTGLLEANPVDLSKVEKVVREVENLRATLRLEGIKTHEQMKALLTPEQREKMKAMKQEHHQKMGHQE